MSETSDFIDPARREISELTNLLQVLVLAIEGSKSDPANLWHYCEDVGTLATRLRASAEKIAALLAGEDSAPRRT